MCSDFKPHRLHLIEAGKQFTIGKWRIMPFEIQHDAEEALGFLISDGRDKLLYASDTYYLKYRFKGLTKIMVEVSYEKEILDENVRNGSVHRQLKNRLIKSHFSLENVKEFLKANDLSRVTEIYLLHLSDKNSDERRFKEEVAKLTGKAVYVA